MELLYIVVTNSNPGLAFLEAGITSDLTMVTNSPCINLAPVQVGYCSKLYPFTFFFFLILVKYSGLIESRSKFWSTLLSFENQERDKG